MSSSRVDILFKTVTLLYRESELGIGVDDSSKELARTVITTFNTNNKNNQLVGGEATIIDDIIYHIQDMIDNPDGHDRDSINQSMSIILKDKPDLSQAIIKSLTTVMTIPGLKRSVLTLRNRLNNYYREFELRKIISKASYAVNTGNLGDDSLLGFAKTLASNIEALTYTSNKTKDPGIVEEIDFTSVDDVTKLFSKVSGDNAKDNLLKLSWEPINDMMQDGFRKGAFVIIPALQHQYKSGLIRTFLAQLARCNVPVLKDPSKKPLMLYISFEDEAEISIEFFYKYLYFSEYNKLPDMDEVTPGEAAIFIKDKLGVTGYNVKMLRVNPSEWTYKNLFNKVLEYEAEGYEIHVTVVDYLSKLPTTGCFGGGITGGDLKDLFTRVRNYFSARNILFITPHQLSTEAKQLIRNGVSPLNFVKEIAGKGYTEISKALDQIVDVEIYIHKAKVDGKWVLTVQRGKDRRTTIVDDDKLYCIIPFPNKAPIPENITNGEIEESGLDGLVI